MTKPRRDEGFTLVEVLIAVAILAAIAALAGPLLRPERADSAWRRGVTGLAAELRQARSHAITSAHEVTIEIDGRERRFVSTAGKSGAFGGQARLTLTLPRTEAIDGDRGRVRFFADGSSSGGTIVITTGQRSAVIRIDPFTGASRVSWDG